MTQDEALKILKTGANIFLTGEPGSGKTHTINAYVAWLRERGIEPAVTASTGIAATHIGGYTIHSWSGIGVRKNLSDYDLDTIARNKRITRRVLQARALIIDEISMLSANTLSMVDTACRGIRHNQKPFGGLQVVLVGDFFQLPPVNRREHETEQQAFSLGDKQRQFAFASPAWKALNPLVCYLSEQHPRS
ncbi:MAG: ATPase AAA [Parcubacteria group bacterium Gr01-1014_66]|nr:MAG: ATPase AAA [Parcubacteria group bacterium Gr01-1014_66]